MTKYKNTGLTPLDEAVAAFVKRVGSLNHPTNLITNYQFNRSANELSTISITFAADYELINFGGKLDGASDLPATSEGSQIQPGVTGSDS